MMADVIKVVQGDTKPLISLTLTDDATGDPFDLSAATTTVSINFRAAGSTATPQVISCAKTDAVNGKVQFDFSGDILNVDPGLYEGEIVVSLDGATHTVYDVLKFRVRADF
jgi:hypothetical protein